MIFKIIIPARANSKRLPGKNMKILGGKPLIQHSIDFALKNFSNKDIWVNSDDREILEFANTKGIMTLLRPDELAADFSSTVDVLKDSDALVLLTEWKEFRSPDFEEIKAQLKTPVIFDGRNQYISYEIEKNGFEYIRIGK